MTPRSRVLAALFFSVSLASCVGVEQYQPYLVPRPGHEAQATAQLSGPAGDRAQCLTAAQGYAAPSPWAALGLATVNGAADNAGPAAVTPLVLATGAAGGLTRAGLEALGITSTAQIRVLNLCLARRGLATGAYDNLSPEQ